MSEIKYEFKGIGSLIKDKELKVPIYQRAYSWGEEHVNALLDDIKSNFNESEYFLGTIVLTENGSKNEIVDGQQRVTTISLIYAGIRNLFSDETRSNGIQAEYLRFAKL